jgi:Tol biopolymer transport system component
MYQRSEVEDGWRLIGFDIWVMYSDGSIKRQLTDSPGYEDGWWSPDGSKIAYISHSPGIFDKDKKSEGDRSKIWVMNADGSDKQQLLSVPYRYGLIAEMQWSPDGTRLAFVWDPDVKDVGSDIYLISGNS